MKTTARKNLLIVSVVMYLTFYASSIAAIEAESLAVAAKNGFINVEIAGQTVVLTGVVDSYESKLLAESVAEDAGYDVINRLQVPAAGGVGYF